MQLLGSGADSFVSPTPPDVQRCRSHTYQRHTGKDKRCLKQSFNEDTVTGPPNRVGRRCAEQCDDHPRDTDGDN